MNQGSFIARPPANHNFVNNVPPVIRTTENPQQGPVQQGVPIRNLDAEFKEAREETTLEELDPYSSQRRSDDLSSRSRAETEESREREGRGRQISGKKSSRGRRSRRERNTSDS